MKNATKFLCMGAVLSAFHIVQTQAQAPQYSIEDMEAMIAEQEIRVKTLADDFLELFQESETYLKNVVEYVSKLEDSQDSKTRVIRLKKMIMSDLQASIQDIANRRRQAMQELSQLPEDYKPGSSQEAVMKLTEEMINERVTAIMSVANSLHKHQDLDKYENYMKSSYDDQVKVKRRVSKDYKRDLKQEQNAEQARREFFENMDRVKFNVKNQIGFMEAEQARAAGTPLANQYEEEIARKKEMLKLLDEHLREVKENNQTYTESVGSLNDAIRLEKDVYEAIQNLKQANARLRVKGMALRQQIDLLNAQKVTLQRTLDAQE